MVMFVAKIYQIVDLISLLKSLFEFNVSFHQ